MFITLNVKTRNKVSKNPKVNCWSEEKRRLDQIEFKITAVENQLRDWIVLNE